MEPLIGKYGSQDGVNGQSTQVRKVLVHMVILLVVCVFKMRFTRLFVHVMLCLIIRGQILSRVLIFSIFVII